jgi:ribosomal protein S18 acetylase RimI-like enzyme
MIEIVTLDKLIADQKEACLLQVEEIFFLSSSLKTFSSIDRRNAFYKRWCTDYQTLYPDEFFIAMEEGKVLGYLSGCSDSTRAINEISVPGFSIYHDLFLAFPAHLHINFHPDARGKGLGSILMNHYMSFLKLNNVMGVHLVTSPDAQNVSFYQRLGFTKTDLRDFNGMPLYFMGCVLISER